ncbi:hypothetical protein FACS1894176_01160 [Bacteroidia bacterium]|nr:hypothetical protein FACS189428_4020 [Clostridia bacterium]GHV24556.1 hypothetical protein FACS1894176_01160 [Bacteroidia bacterium]
MIGIVSVVVMLGIGQGAEKRLMDQLGELAKNQIQVYKGRDENKKKVTITIDTVRYLEKVFPLIDQQIIYETNGSSQLPTKNQYGGNDSLTYYGVPINWFETNDRELLYGSFFSQKQYDNTELVTVIGEDLYTYYFPKKNNPIGEKLTINGKIFAVVGVMKKPPRE